ncbi:Lysophospholipase L1 [Geodermatophilus pulveris]|uniref:Lysophospholipase L1 n=1 Tax=Geodermatophilus pulveris TaxID=1564159 RepID=A0A239AZ24_9ACTN|nr:SGNH/GDSL hydrolase family protein [Geodermatophilus pulveris]SNS00759.1 Lysophospholipase L1 [Geodermatophilus pulveris]
MAERLTPARRVLARTAAAVVLLTPVAGCGPEADAARPAPPAAPTAAPVATTAAPEPEAAPSRFAVVGDSITAGGAVISGARADGPASWVPAAAEAAGLAFTGGWAVPGATTEDALAAVVPADADLLVVMLGTNDVLRDRPWEESAADLTAIAAAAGERPVAVVTIAPSDPRPDARRAYNAALATLALERGWVLVDPWGDVASGDRFVPGTTTDGTHLTDAAAQLVGARLGERLAVLG